MTTKKQIAIIALLSSLSIVIFYQLAKENHSYNIKRKYLYNQNLQNKEITPANNLDGIISFDVFTDNKHRIHLAADDGENQYYLWSDDGGNHWSKPTLVATASSNSRPGNDIRLAVRGQHLIILWQGKGEYPGWGRTQVAISNDAGRHWRPGRNPATENISSNQSYFSLSSSHNNFHLLWLDDRGETGNNQQLRYSQSTDGNDWHKDTLVDSDACTCCGLSTLHAEGQLFTLYRGTMPRDMNLAAHEIDSHHWKKLGPVGQFNWAFTGCPHQGGSLAASRKADTTILHSLVWTGQKSMKGLYYLSSFDKGASWEKQQKIGKNDAGNADISIAGGRAIIAWHETNNRQHSINVMTAGENNNDNLSYYKETNSVVHPRVTTYKNVIKLFWLDDRNSNNKQLKMASISPT